jgi:hypothetical protein
MQSSSEIHAILELGITSMHSFPARPIEHEGYGYCMDAIDWSKAWRTNFDDWAALLAFLPALLWFTPVT